MKLMNQNDPRVQADQLKDALKQSELHVEHLTKKGMELEEQRDNLIHEREELRSQVNQLETYVTDTETESSYFERQLGKAREERDALKKKLEWHEDGDNSLNEVINDLSERLVEKGVTLADREHEMTIMSQQLDEYVRKYARLDEKHIALESVVKNAKRLAKDTSQHATALRLQMNIISSHMKEELK